MNDQIEYYILNGVLKNIIHEEEQISYILRKNLEKLSLSNIELELIKQILSKNNISLIDEPPKKIVIEHKYKEFSVNKPSKISDNNDSKELKAPETYSKFSRYIENTFIPNNIVILQTKNTEKSNFFIKKSDIEKLELNELQLKVLKEILKENNIYILRDNKENKSLKDIEYYSNQKNVFLTCNISEQDTEKLIKTYQKSKDPFVKEQLIIANMKLVKYISLKLSKQYNMDLTDIEDIGYEGLIESIDKYNEHKNKFPSFAYKYIEKFIINNLGQIMGIEQKKWLNDFIKYKQQLEKETGQNVRENPELLEEIINKMSNNTKIPQNTREFLRKTFGFYNLDSYEEELEHIDDNAPENLALNEVREEQLKKDLEIILNDFTVKEQKILKHRFGLNGEKLMTNIELARIYGVTQERIRQIEVKALKKLRHPNRTEILREFYKDDYNDQTHYDITQKKKR